MEGTHFSGSLQGFCETQLKVEKLTITTANHCSWDWFFHRDTTKQKLIGSVCKTSHREDGWERVVIAKTGCHVVGTDTEEMKV